MTALSKKERATATPIYFSDFFNIPTEVLEEYGAFNVSLTNDLPLLIDPFLLFDSEDEDFKALHEEIIRYVKFLRDVSVDPTISRGYWITGFAFQRSAKIGLASARRVTREVGWEATSPQFYSAICITSLRILARRPSPAAAAALRREQGAFRLHL